MKAWRVQRYGFTYDFESEDEILEESFMKSEFCEQQMLDWIVANVAHEGIWVDCGANIGNHTMVFATACEADTVMAFEPAPINFGFLEYNVSKNTPGNVIAMRLGVGMGPKLFGITNGGSGKNCQLRLSTSPNPNVATVALDSIVPWQGVRLIKMDIEGMERIGLQCAAGIITESRPEIFVEIWHDDILQWARKWLGSFGYRLIERWNHAPTYHFSASGRYPTTYTKPKS